MRSVRRVRTSWTSGAGLAARLGVAVVLALGAGCGSEGRGPGDDPVTGHQDDYAYNGVFQVDEAHVVAEVQGDQLLVDVPVRDPSGADLRGKVRVELLDLDGKTVASGTGELAIAGVGVARVALSAAGLATPGTLEVTQLLHYEVTVGETVAQGYRSLFYAMPKLDLRTQMPSTLLEGGASKMRVFALDPTRDSVLPGVRVTLRLTSPGTEPVVLSAVTGDDGSAVFDVPAQEAGQYTMEASAEQGDTVVATMDEDVEVVRDNRVLVTSDKPIYKPGQTMHLRALALKKPLLHAVAGVDATLEVFDGKGNMVFRKYAPTNDFGIASTDFKLATEVNTGTYEIRVTVGETTTSKSVEVKPYALPKFKVTTDLGVPFALAGETLHGTVSAQYFFGKPVAGGQVEIVARGTDVGLTEFATLSGTTNASGVYTFDLDLPAYLVGTGIESGNATATFEVTVTDTAGQVEKKLASLVVASRAVNLAAIPESGAVVAGLDNALYLFATTPLGAPVAATFTATANEQPLAVEDLGDGMARVTAFVGEEGLDLLVTAKTEEGEEATQSLRFEPGQASEGLLLRTDRALYRVGDTVELTVVSTSRSGRVFLDVIKDGQTQLTDAVDLVDGRATYALDLDGGLVGDVVLEAYHVAPDASIVRDKKLVFVRDAKGLDIALTTDQAQYEPGDEATLTFQVSDTQGLPAVAALGVQVVDEAVYALTEMRPGLLETYFLIQKALQEPRYEIDHVSFDLTSVVSQPPEDAGAQTVAGAAFAALDTDEAAGERSSWTEALRDLSPTLRPAFERHRQAVEAHFATLADAGVMTYENARDLLDAQGVFYDYWGNPYTFEPQEDWEGLKATMHSMGPDEVDGTVDDWTGTVKVFDYQRMWDAAEDGGFEAPPQAGGGPGGGFDAAASADAGAPAPEGEDGPVKVRKDFPETLYFNPALITDESGRAQVTLQMADSITEWRVSTVANTVDGALGSATDGITVFQDFFVDISFPASLTQNDEVTFPIAIYNYLPTPQTVTVEVTPAGWFTLLGGASQTVELAPSQVASVSFPVRVDEVGVHALTVTGYGSQMSDAVQRVVRVKPDGKRFDDAASGMLEGAATHTVTFPADTIPHSQSVLVKIYPGIMAQAVEGLDSMLQMPHGCFEQTTASNWPNTLVLDYLRATGQVSPEIELKALDYVQQGYQRLLTFECTGGGFVWFGDPAPANVVLSAMGVLEFSDMAKVIDVDPAVIERTAAWLAANQNADGSWHTDRGSEFATVQYDDVKTTAFSAWALASSGLQDDAVQAALGWLSAAAADPTTDVYSLAMMGNAFAAADPHGQTTGALLDALADQAQTDAQGRVWWTYEGADFNYWGGEAAADGQASVNPTSIEVTALAVQAFLATGEHLDLVQGAIGFLAGQKDSLGNYGTTHATILTLRAMIQSLSNKTEEGEGTVTVSVDGAPVASLAITEENRNVFHQFDLTDEVDPSQPAEVTVSYEGTGNLMYQVLSAYYLPIDEATMPPGEALDITVSYDKTQLQVNDTVTATAVVRNLTQGQLDMVLVDLGIPPGFSVIPDKLVHMVEAGTIMKFELAGQQLSLYLDHMTPGQELSLAYDLVANYPVKAKAPTSSAYLYYDEDTKAETPGAEMEVQ